MRELHLDDVTLLDTGAFEARLGLRFPRLIHIVHFAAFDAGVWHALATAFPAIYSWIDVVCMLKWYQGENWSARGGKYSGRAKYNC